MKKNIIITPTTRPRLLLTEDEQKEAHRELREKQERVWKRIDKAKHPPRRELDGEVSADGFPLHSFESFSKSYRLRKRKLDFEDTLYYMLSELHDAIKNNKTLSADEVDRLRHTRDAFQRSIWQLEKHNEEDIDWLEALIAAAYEIGAFAGQHPIKRKLNTAPAVTANKANKGRPPKWSTFAREILATKPGLPPKSVSGKADKIHPDLVKALKAHENKTGQKIKAPSVRTLRNHIAKMNVGRNRT